jgi:hypothetical protein
VTDYCYCALYQHNQVDYNGVFPARLPGNKQVEWGRVVRLGEEELGFKARTQGGLCQVNPRFIKAATEVKARGVFCKSA